MRLSDFFRENKKAALAFSGGVDSSFLLACAVKEKADVRPFFVKSQFQPAFELRDAKRLCRDIGAKLTVIEADVLSSGAIASNTQERCYHCKKKIFRTLFAAAKESGLDVVIDGTNASDDASDRPGMRALAEYGVRSPLRECGLTKRDIRAKSKEFGLFTWNKPAYACLATRIPTGRRIDGELLKRVEAAEETLFSLGFSDFRVRVFHDAARLQFAGCELQRAFEIRSEILEKLKKQFDTVLTDMETR